MIILIEFHFLQKYISSLRTIKQTYRTLWIHFTAHIIEHRCSKTLTRGTLILQYFPLNHADERSTSSFGISIEHPREKEESLSNVGCTHRWTCRRHEGTRRSWTGRRGSSCRRPRRRAWGPGTAPGPARRCSPASSPASRQPSCAPSRGTRLSSAPCWNQRMAKLPL